eukprot:COSAG05_NODE_861_length_6899_cov_5.421618_3_plen_401_part_00
MPGVKGHDFGAPGGLPDPCDVDTSANGGKALVAALRDLDAARVTLQACKAVRPKNLPATLSKAFVIETGKAEERVHECELHAQKHLAEYNGDAKGESLQQTRAHKLRQWLDSAELLMAEGMTAAELTQAVVRHLTVQRAVARPASAGKHTLPFTSLSSSEHARDGEERLRMLQKQLADEQKKLTEALQGQQEQAEKALRHEQALLQCMKVTKEGQQEEAEARRQFLAEQERLADQSGKIHNVIVRLQCRTQGEALRAWQQQHMRKCSLEATRRKLEERLRPARRLARAFSTWAHHARQMKRYTVITSRIRARLDKHALLFVLGGWAQLRDLLRYRRHILAIMANHRRNAKLVLSIDAWSAAVTMWVEERETNRRGPTLSTKEWPSIRATGTMGESGGTGP